MGMLRMFCKNFSLPILGLLGVVCAGAVASTTSPARADLVLGVNSPRGQLIATKRWTALAKALGVALGEKVTLRTFKPPEQIAAFRNKEMDFLLTPPTFAVAAMEIAGARSIATIDFPAGSQFAGVIVVNPNAGIKTAADLRGKKVMGLKPGAAGGHAFQTYHLLKAGVKVPDDLAKYEITNNQDNAVLAVRAGLFDAGFVRTGVVEAMLKGGKIKPGDVVILEGVKESGRPWTRTTALYPEWSFLVQSGTSAKTIEATRKALLEMDAASEAAKTARIKGFVEPISLNSVTEMMRELRLAPFNK
jgi:ABC-type phosphate/phosphonate transport system substrate-binding protein